MSRAIPGDRSHILTQLQQTLHRNSNLSVLFAQLLAKKLSIYPTDMECLGFLLLKPTEAIAGDLAALTGLTTGAITGVIDRLEKAGFIQRERDVKDRRKVFVLPNIERIGQEIAPLYQSLLDAFDALYEHYTNAELAAILDFNQRSETILRSEIEKVRDTQ
ncbi:MarR family transcriptional regulator [Ktedonosporobacter rubrisoli]|uniref:MarR family transcriptional regulator n=1 Tax=Ktedonosporobacter rubrisoli TaxID=2509675 RepID=A0A4V0YYA7_KTERU|nr:MarR family transcriptional regulator [Ktedonosporobacter rubrisoli]QBD75561.1 MarR family transcriptional regulator [Ktedonosporobacter rubrisoli]